MLHNTKLRKRGLFGFTLRAKRLAAAIVLAFLLPAAASAYTVVLLSGRTVEIPAAFNVSRSGITYEYAPGVLITIQMTSIDVAATERANREPAGSLLKRAGIRSGPNPSAARSQGNVKGRAVARRTLTNMDLEAARARRVESESQYETRRRELGLPTAEETLRQTEAETRRLQELSSDAEANRAESESYWRERATELRTAIATTDAEINYVRAKINETTDYYPTASFQTNTFSTITGFSSFPVFASPVSSARTRFGRIPGRTSFPSATPGSFGRERMNARTTPVRGRAGFGGGPARGRLIFNSGRRASNFGQRVITTPGFGGWPLLPVYSAPYSYDYSYERSVLVTRLHELEAERAGLQARWRLLEDEARRAGALPGWLRP